MELQFFLWFSNSIIHLQSCCIIFFLHVFIRKAPLSLIMAFISCICYIPQWVAFSSFWNFRLRFVSLIESSIRLFLYTKHYAITFSLFCRCGHCSKLTLLQNWVNLFLFFLFTRWKSRLRVIFHRVTLKSLWFINDLSYNWRFIGFFCKRHF